MFEGLVTGNIPEVLDNGEVTEGTRHRRAACPCSDALRASGRPANEHGSIRQQRSRHPVLDDRVTAELTSNLNNNALAPPVGLQRAGGRGGHEKS